MNLKSEDYKLIIIENSFSGVIIYSFISSAMSTSLENSGISLTAVIIIDT